MSQQDAGRINYVREFTKLSLWYAHKRFREGDTDFEGTINGRVNIYRNTILHDGKRHPANEDVGPEWAAILNQLKKFLTGILQTSLQSSLRNRDWSCCTPT